MDHTTPRSPITGATSEEMHHGSLILVLTAAGTGFELPSPEAPAGRRA